MAHQGGIDNLESQGDLCDLQVHRLYKTPGGSQQEPIGENKTTLRLCFAKEVSLSFPFLSCCRVLLVLVVSLAPLAHL